MSKKEDVYFFYRMKRQNGLYCLERLKTDGKRIIEIKDGEENMFEIIHENLSMSVRNDLAMGTDDDKRLY